MPRVGIPLEGGQIVEQGRLFGRLPTFGLDDLCFTHRLNGGTSFLRGSLCVELLHRKGGEGRSVFGCVELESEIGLRRERGVFQIALANERQRRGLHPAQRPNAAASGDGKCLRGVDPHHPVGFAAGPGREVEVIVVAAGTDAGQPLANGPFGEAADPQPVKRHPAAKVVIDVPEDQLALTSGIGRYDDPLSTGEQLFEHSELFQGPGIGFVLLAAFDAAGFEDECFRQDRQVLPAETFEAVSFWHGRAYEVAESPRDGVASPFDITVPAGGGSHDGGDLLRYRRLFCYNDFHG